MKSVSGSGNKYVLDSFALLAHFNNEPGGKIVREILEHGRISRHPLLLSAVNLSECLYITERRVGGSATDDMYKVIKELPVLVVKADDALAVAAACFKAHNRISLADAFAAALAVQKSATLVTGDLEFKTLEKTIPIRWLPQRGRITTKLEKV